VLLRAAARIAENDPELARHLRVVVLGAPSGVDPQWLPGLARSLGVEARFVPPSDGARSRPTTGRPT